MDAIVKISNQDFIDSSVCIWRYENSMEGPHLFLWQASCLVSALAPRVRRSLFSDRGPEKLSTVLSAIWWSCKASCITGLVLAGRAL